MSVARNAVLAALIVALAVHTPTRGQEAADAKKSALQQKCADAKEKSPLPRFRLDGYSIKTDQGKETVVLKGKFLPAGTGPIGKEKEAFNTAMEAACKTVLNKTELSVDHSGVEFVALKELPHVKLQTAANAENRDMVLLEPAAFDKDGKATLTARVGSEDDKTWLLAAAKKHLPDYAVNADAVKVVEWKVGRSTLQKKFATTGGNLARVRVERVKYEWVPTPEETLARRMSVSGVFLDSPQEAAAFEPMCRELWPELPWQAEPPLTVDHASLFGAGGNLPDATLFKALRAAVADAPALDGVRIDEKMSFDEKGNLVLTGIIPTQDATFAAELAAAVQKVTAAAGKVPDRTTELTFARATTGGVSTAKMTHVAMTKLLAEVRAKVAEEFDDVLIGRQRFDKDGKLTLVGRYAPAADGAAIKAVYQAVAATYFPANDATAKNADVTLTAFGAGLTAHIRGVVEADQKKWSGVLVERGYFTPKGEYAVRGLADRADQPPAMAELIATESKNARWAGYFDTPAAPVALDLMPLAPMLARLQRVCPGYEAFDHFEVTGVVQHPRDGLVLSVDSHALAKNDAAQKAATDTAAWLLKNHPDWKRRAKPGVRLNVSRVELSDETRWISPNLAAALLAAGKTPQAAPFLASAIRHVPESSGTWYLSALTNALAGDDELVQRDLYRVIQMEGELLSMTTGEAKNHPRTRRYELAEKIIGPKRVGVESLEPKLRREMRDGLQQITLVPLPLVGAK